jgi:hypothetical protein
MKIIVSLLVAASLLAATVAPTTAADTVRLEIPERYRGSWAPDASGCNEPAQRVVLSAKAYTGPKTNCRIISVSETPGQSGPNYSARLECTPKGESNLIIQPQGKDTVLSGHDMQNLKTYQRCNSMAATDRPSTMSTLPALPAQRPDQTVAERIAEWFKTCMDDWDRATHMTKARRPQTVRGGRTPTHRPPLKS